MYKAYYSTGVPNGKQFKREKLSSDYKRLSGFFFAVDRARGFGWKVVVIECIE